MKNIRTPGMMKRCYKYQGLGLEEPNANDNGAKMEIAWEFSTA